MFHCFRHLVTIGGPHIGCGLHHRAPALAPRRLRPTHVHRRRAVSSRTLIQINILDRRLATAFLYSPQLRKSPMSPGIPPGNSGTRAASRKPCGLRSRSHRTHMSDASPHNVAGQLSSPKNSFPRALPLGVPGASDRASFRPKRDGQPAVPPRDAVPPRQHGDLPPDAGFFARVIRHKLPKICRHRCGSSGSSGGRARFARSWLWSIRCSSQPMAPVRPPVSVSYLSPSASALTRSARLTMPTIRPSRSTGTRFIRWAVSSRAIVSISASSATVTTGVVMTSRARRSGP